jgi:hypothetical protein
MPTFTLTDLLIFPDLSVPTTSSSGEDRGMTAPQYSVVCMTSQHMRDTQALQNEQITQSLRWHDIQVFLNEFE